jgi:hypothetical protein
LCSQCRALAGNALSRLVSRATQENRRYVPRFFLCFLQSAALFLNAWLSAAVHKRISPADLNVLVCSVTVDIRAITVCGVGGKKIALTTPRKHRRIMILRHEPKQVIVAARIDSSLRRTMFSCRISILTSPLWAFSPTKTARDVRIP